MAEKVPVKAIFTGADVTALGEFAATDTLSAGNLPAATETAQGAVELATNSEALIGNDTGRGVTPDDLKFVLERRTFNRNLIINGGFTVNQRLYTSGAALTVGGFGHDRWKAGASGGTYSFTQLASNTTITIAAGKSLIQVIEDKNVVGGNYMLSWTGTAQARVGLDSDTPSGGYSDSPIGISGQSAGTVMSVEFGPGTVGKVQLEPGTKVTPFEFRHFTQELLMCQRYFQMLLEANTDYSIPIIRFSTTGFSITWLPRVEMRAAPTIWLLGSNPYARIVGYAADLSGPTGVNVTAIGMSAVSSDHFIQLDCANDTLSGADGAHCNFDTTGFNNTYIGASAEL